MFENLGIFKMASAMASHAGRRQALTAQNMANVDTPGFRAQRLPKFSDMTSTDGSSVQLRATRSGHMHGIGTDVANARIVEDRMNSAPDGNSVTVEREMLESVSAKREHDRAIAIYKSALTILHSTLARQ